jgi:hypothetical protein
VINSDYFNDLHSRDSATISENITGTMSSSHWRPHGLVTKQLLEESYRAAKASVDKDGYNAKEHYTVTYFEDLFNKVIFSNDHFKVNSQIPPASKKGTEKACDLVIKYFDQDWQGQVLCFAECKRREKTSRSNIRDLEMQARGYCQDYLAANSKTDVVYACTLVGVWVRAWIIDRDMGGFKALWGENKLGMFDSYKDTGADENKQLLEWAFESMKSVPPQVVRIGQSYHDIGSNIYAVPGGILGSSPGAAPAPAAAAQTQTPVQVDVYESQSLQGTVYCFTGSGGMKVETLPEEWQQVTTTSNGEANYYYMNARRSVWTWRMGSEQMGSDQDPKGKGRQR